MKHAIICVFLAFFAFACSLQQRTLIGQGEQSDQKVYHKDTTTYKIVEIIYGTDRKPIQSTKSFAYGAERGITAKGYETGITRVSIPERHKEGELETQGWLSHAIYGDRPDKFVTLLGIQPSPDSAMLLLKKMVAQSSGKDAFIFIHGYNNSFEDAAFRTAQLAYDIGFEGAPILFSWPSTGTIAGYTVDENNSEWAVPHFKAFVREVIAEAKPKKIHLIAHSMGNRVLSNTLKELQRENGNTLFDQVIMAAPDIDADIFRRDIAPYISKTAKRVTLYSSSNDWALKTSKQLHAYIRVGETGKDIFLCNDIQTIDASFIKTSGLGHSYFVEEPPILNDIYLLVKMNLDPDTRNLRKVNSAKGTYWAFKH